MSSLSFDDYESSSLASDDTAPDDSTEQLARVREEVRNLRIALNTNRRIGVAVGVVMMTYRVTDEQAFDILVRLSQQLHKKMHVLAEDIILTGVVEATPQA